MPGTKSTLNQWQVVMLVGMPVAAAAVEGVNIVYVRRDEERSDHTVPGRERCVQRKGRRQSHQLGHFAESDTCDHVVNRKNDTDTNHQLSMCQVPGTLLHTLNSCSLDPPKNSVR